MSEQKNGSFGKRKVWIGGGIAAAAVIVAVSSGVDFPPSGKDTVGTIVPAQRFRADQPATSGVAGGGRVGHGGPPAAAGNAADGRATTVVATRHAATRPVATRRMATARNATRRTGDAARGDADARRAARGDAAPGRMPRRGDAARARCGPMATRAPWRCGTAATRRTWRCGPWRCGSRRCGRTARRRHRGDAARSDGRATRRVATAARARRGPTMRHRRCDPNGDAARWPSARMATRPRRRPRPERRAAMPTRGDGRGDPRRPQHRGRAMVA